MNRTRRAVAMVLGFLLVAGLPPATALAQPDPLTNLDHLDFLGDRVVPPEQEGHTTYQLESDPSIGVLWTYAEPGPDGEYRRLGGGAYDPVTDTYGQGAFNADDISRAAVVYVRHWMQFGDDHSRTQAYELLRGLTYLQTVSGENQGNVVLWMQPDGTLNPSADPPELPDPSDSGASYWLARTIWALGEGYRAFRDADPAFAAFLQQRLELAIDAVDRQVLTPNYGEMQTVDGLQWPSWLIVDGADASSEAIYGLSAYQDAGGSSAGLFALQRLGQGVALMQLGSVGGWPYRAIMPWAQSRSVWHAWGDQMSGALATAGAIVGDASWVGVAVREVGSFTPHLLIQSGPENGWLPAPADRTQIAYGADATLQNLVRTGVASGRSGFLDLAGIAAAWYFGNNPAGEPMYDPETGRTYDGIDPGGAINRNSGAESTIHGLLSMLLLDEHPDIAARALIAGRETQVTWQLVEAEAGDLSGAAEVVTPPSAWTGESLWSGGAYVSLASGGSVNVAVDLLAGDRYRVFGVSERQQIPLRAVELAYELDGVAAGRQPQGGAGPQGITPTPGYLGVGQSRTMTMVDAGPGVVSAAFAGSGGEARLDAVLLQPEIEWLVLGGDGEHQGVLRSFSDRLRHQRIEMGDGGRPEARVYSDLGVLVRTVRGQSGVVLAPVIPGGFTLVTSG
ncbi:MAG TPA: hypothetical protein VHM94_12490 [Acidimicrobiia bacterium]|nr:hypothetical protein [Acidimicrobiia bacterium]